MLETPGEKNPSDSSDDRVEKALEDATAESKEEKEEDPLAGFTPEFRALLPKEKRTIDWTEAEILRLQFFLDTLTAMVAENKLYELVARAIMNFDILKTILQDDVACFYYLDERSPTNPAPNEWRMQLLARLKWEIGYFSDKEHLHSADNEIKTWLVRAQQYIAQANWESLKFWEEIKESERVWKFSRDKISKLKQTGIALHACVQGGPYKNDWLAIFPKWNEARKLLRKAGYQIA